MAKLTPVWLPPEIHQEFREFTVKRQETGYNSLYHLLRFYKQVEKRDKPFFKAINDKIK